MPVPVKGALSRFKRALEDSIKQYNRVEEEGRDTTEAAQTVIMLAVLYQNELLQELIGRTTPL